MRFPKLHKKHEQFLAPTRSKLLLATALFVFTAVISPLIYRYLILNAHLTGLPLPFFFRGTNFATFFWIYLAVDLVFWYLMACVLTHLGKVIKKG
ncbi:hypothetical protein A2886_00405 [candidate division WWE3 bacterium RIFCSPHIGHO2_01_FULL_42_13]|uniref:Uncharacterized protein n=1 Tax=candidate division WWE3 bacterium RIFCSPHIGHO2_01_FULL_42_13 TaxID=1802617 RepID=A0A1F4USD3_UNCKA|nr:MAG: hypothetical protein A2886_00405 [candidate division WWE3 bacterium RIFCSPHIGHO2_01_FULL_42_13]